MRNVPELRFAGFDGKWDEKELSKIANFSKGKGYSKTDLKNSGNSLYLYGEMYTNYKSQINDVETFTDKIKANSVLSKGNEVLIPSSGETAIDLARASHMNIPKVLLGGDLNIIEPINDFDSHFLALELSNGTVKKSLAKKAQGKSVVHLYNTDIKNQKIQYPCIEEQEKIGDLFKKIDALIEIQEGKVSKMEDFKKSMLQKMFPNKGKLVPDFRFDGFDGDWSPMFLKDLVYSEYKGKAMVDKLILSGGTEYLDTERLNGGTPILVNNDPDTSLDDILILWDGSKAGAIYTKFEGILGSTLRGFKINEGNDSYFIYSFLKMNENLIENKYRTPNIPHVVKDFSKVFEIKVPSYKEQQKIGGFFKNLDTQIENEEKLLDSYKMMKKSLLQKMFV